MASGEAQCLKCGMRWRSLVMCHCPNECHENFSDVEAFDFHRRNGNCLPPESIKIVKGQHVGKPRLVPATHITTNPPSTVWKRNDFREHYRIARGRD